jgi:hypothetical protein
VDTTDCSNVCGAEVFSLIGNGATSMGDWHLRYNGSAVPFFKGQKSNEEVFTGHYPYGTITQGNEFLKFTIVKA